MKRVVALLISSIFIVGCGYKPSSHYAKSVVGESVSTTVVISNEDPRNSVIIKDSIDEAILERFKSRVTTKDKASTHLKVTLVGYSLTPQQYDQNGYVILERTTVNLKIVRTTGDEVKSYSTHGVHDFSIQPNGIVTDELKFTAIKEGAAKAIDSFIARISAEGVIKGR